MKNTLLRNLFIVSGLLLVPMLGMAISAVQPSGDGSMGSPYQITTMDNLYWISQNSASWGSYFEQTADIDATESASLDTSDGWTPIGNSTINFTGNYDGQDHAISNLFIDRAENFQALFGYCTGATIENLDIIDANITGVSYVGALGAYLSASNVSNCSTSGSVVGSSYYVGGLIGRVNAGNVEYSNSSTTVTNTGYRAGGLIGHTDTGVTVSHCYATGNVSGPDRVGGLIGFVDSQTAISYCFATGEVTDTGNYGGGLVGRLESTNSSLKSTISNCYATGRVNGTSMAGGLVGSVYSYSIVENSYSTGYVTGTSDVDGFVGHQFGGTVSNCFFDRQTSGDSYSDYATATTTENMKIESTFTVAGWDFASVWDMDGTTNDGYAFLTENTPPEIPMPITLTSFTAKAKNGSVTLAWETASETNNAQFLIYRNNEVIATIAGAGTSSEPHSYSVVDDAVIPGLAYTYVLADVSYANEVVKHQDLAITVTLPNDMVEADYVIGAAYPNPFNPSAILPLELNSDATVKASLYDLNGREIKGLVNGNLSAGTHELHIDGTNMTTGIYMVKILVNDIMRVQKIALVK